MSESATGALFTRLESAPAYVRLAESIEREIVSGRIRLGDRIGTEASLSQQFGVNRSTVREGIRLLEQSGMLRRDSSRRLQASLPQYQGLATRVSRALVLHETSFRELWEATLSLETATVEAAARHATGEDIRELRENLARNHAAAGNIEREVELDSEFHAIVARIARNRVLQLAREPAALLFAPTLRIIMQHNIRAGQRNLEAHEKITDALAANNATEARLWMERHLKDWRQGFINAGRDLEEPVERTFITDSSDLRG